MTVVSAIVKAFKKEDTKVDKKYIVVKPRILSDENILRGISALKAVLTFIPPATMVVPILGLGEVGFNIWKHIALSSEYDTIKFPPMDPNVLKVLISVDQEFKKHYTNLIEKEHWSEENIEELEQVYNDFSFITNFKLLRAKYPNFNEDYIQTKCNNNKNILQMNLSHIEQEIQKVSHTPEIEYNIQTALDALKNIFPAMRDWALFNSKGFNELINLIDIIV